MYSQVYSPQKLHRKSSPVCCYAAHRYTKAPWEYSYHIPSPPHPSNKKREHRAYTQTSCHNDGGLLPFRWTSHCGLSVWLLGWQFIIFFDLKTSRGKPYCMAFPHGARVWGKNFTDPVYLVLEAQTCGLRGGGINFQSPENWKPIEKERRTKYLSRFTYLEAVPCSKVGNAPGERKRWRGDQWFASCLTLFIKPRSRIKNK